jgi:2-polyprenyl-3-methyl-5-hydroxy-6-metoxy-1,4-benzoquinol methylase
MKLFCPVCASDNAVTARTVETSDIKKIYSIIGINVTSEFEGHSVIHLNICQDCDCQFFYPELPGSAGFYEQLQSNHWYYPNEKSEFDFASTYISGRNSVLEIGCGKGAFTSHFTCAEYVGLEYTETSVAAARSRGLNVFRESIQEYASRAHEAHDVVCFFQVLEHVPDVCSFLTSSIRCLRPGGLLILSVPSADSFLSYSINNILNMPPHHVTRWSTRALCNLGKRFNLEVVDQQHEQMADEHLQNYLETMMLLASSKEYRKLMPLTDLSFSYRLRIKIASRLAKLVAPAFHDRSLRAPGHSITFVYRKRD